jgi:hypothetical protein
MTVRGNIPPIDRVWACLPYVLPIAGSLIYAAALINLAPITSILLAPLMMIGMMYMNSISILGQFGPLLIFFGLYLFVVRNPQISHFIRYNTMQALMIGIVISLLETLFSFMQLSITTILMSRVEDPLGYIVQFLFAGFFMLVAACYCYSIFCAVQGKYAEIKGISDAAYAQTQI